MSGGRPQGRRAAALRARFGADGWTGVTAWILVLVWGAWAVARLLGLESGYPLVPLMAYTPFFAAATIVPLALALFWRRWVPAALLALIFVYFLSVVLPRAIPGPGDDGGGRALRVVSANLYRGAADPHSLLALVREERADLLSVQELTPAMAARLERLGIRRVLPHAVVSVRPGAYGTAIYSRFGLRQLPSPPPRGFRMPRALLSVPGYGPVRFVAVHTDAPLNSSGAAKWSEELGTLPDGDEPGPPWLLAGDFNATLDHAELRRIIDSGYIDAADATGDGLEFTWPADSDFPPPVTIDHVLLSETGGVSDYSVLDLPGSDHHAIFAEVRLP